MFKDNLNTELNKLKVDEALLNKTRQRIRDAQNAAPDQIIERKPPLPSKNIGVFFRTHSILIAALLTGIIGLGLFSAVFFSGLLGTSKSTDMKMPAQDVDHNTANEKIYTGDINSDSFEAYDENETRLANADEEDACLFSIAEEAPDIGIDTVVPSQSSIRDSIGLSDEKQVTLFTSQPSAIDRSVTIVEYRDPAPETRKHTPLDQPELPLIEIVISDITDIDAPIILSSYWVPGYFESAVIVDGYLYIAALSAPITSGAADDIMLQFAIDDLPWINIETVFALSDTIQSYAIIGAINMLDAQTSPSGMEPQFFVAVTGGILDVSIGEDEIVIRDSAELSQDAGEELVIRFYTDPTLGRMAP